MAETTTVSLRDVDSFKRKALRWADRFPVFCLLDSNDHHNDVYHSREWVLAVDAIAHIEPRIDSFDELAEFQAAASADIFGFLSYDLKNQVERLTSTNPDRLGFPDLYFFQPRYLLEINRGKITINRNYPEAFHIVEQIEAVEDLEAADEGVDLRSKTNQAQYINNVKKIRQQIVDGDYYELNYCVEFYRDDIHLDAVGAFIRLNSRTQAPFSTLFKFHEKYLLSASPERFLKRDGAKLISQPMKGTIRKGRTADENTELMMRLEQDEKERAENLMIVDLVRNDLSKSCKPGSVKVPELCKVKEFRTVNQMISTITGECETDSITAIKNAFPMGSMTGAPKVEVMKNIEQLENFRRGLYSGSVGYFKPNGDFDFNVVIRSVLYDHASRKISVPIGSAITYDSIAENEWNELEVKLHSIGFNLSN